MKDSMKDASYENRINFLPKTPLEPKQPPQRFRRVIFLCFILFILILGGGKIFQTLSHPADTASPIVYDPDTLEPVKPKGVFSRIKQFVFGSSEALAGHEEDRINILLLGMGGPGHDGPFLTDTIMVVSIKPSTEQIAMISIPRDLGVNIAGHGWYKINHANAFGETKAQQAGAAFATKVIEDNFGINIHYYTRIDFAGFEKVIDDIGGIKVNVERSFTDYEYPAANHLYQVVSFKQGPQVMNGKTALQFARSRKGNNGEGSDFARAARQQKVILALKEKVLSFGTLANPVQINNILNTLESHINTNLQFSDMVSLLRLAKEMDTKNIITVVLDDGPNGYLVPGTSTGGAFILSPRTGNFTEIKDMFTNVFDTKPAVVDDTPPQNAPLLTPVTIEIQNGTWIPGFAARTKQTVEDLGLPVASVDNTQKKPYTESGIYLISNAQAGDVLQTLRNELRIPIKQTVPTGEITKSDTDILIILGEDIVEEETSTTSTSE